MPNSEYLSTHFILIFTEIKNAVTNFFEEKMAGKHELGSLPPQLVLLECGINIYLYTTV